MKLGYVLQNLKLIERNSEWLGAPISFSTKLAYYPAILASYLGLLTRRHKRITYLGRPFDFDNPATPLNLQNYPYEVGIKLLAHLPKTPEFTLDVGANIGQFSRTLAYLVPQCKIDSIEPNPEIFETLQVNTKGTLIKPYNCGLGEAAGETSFFYEPGRSGIGSFLKANAGNQDHLRELKVKIVADVARVTGRNSYDLIKIDVEGFEYEVLSTLNKVRAKYLFVEASGTGRQRNYTDGQFLDRIRTTLGDFNILYASGFEHGNITYELLLEFL